MKILSYGIKRENFKTILGKELDIFFYYNFTRKERRERVVLLSDKIVSLREYFKTIDNERMKFFINDDLAYKNACELKKDNLIKKIKK